MRTRGLTFLLILGCACFVKSAYALDIPLGGIGGVGDVVPGTGLVSVTSVTPGGPGALAGLQPGDLIQGANGIPFSSTATDTDMGYVGAIQDLAMALDRAEGGSGALSLQVIRSGVGGITLDLNLNPVGSLGPAWPVNTGKTAAMFEWSCDQIHAKVQASSSGDFGYNSGWFGMILLAHPDWNQTSGANPFRNSINKLRTRCQNYINGRILEPAEAYYWNGSNVVANPAYVDSGLENWDICTSAMFLALYRSKTGDTTADAVVQRAAEVIAHRIQHWRQYDDPGAPHILGGGVGRMGHGGVHGDYSHGGGIGALNIINAHALPALALLKNAGANMNTNLGLSINAFTYNAGLSQPTIEQKFRICWDYVKAATTVGGGDDGNVGYVVTQSGWDSAGRTPGCFAGWKLYGMTANSDDTDKSARQADYFTRLWYRQQHAHAYTVGGVALSQLAMPFLDYRRERFFQENSRLYPALARKPDGTIAYFPGRQNNGGDGYLNYENVALINAAMPVAIRTGNLPGFPAPDSTRIHAWMRSPVNTWPSIAARRVVLSGGLGHSLDLDITDANGTILAPANYTAAWTHVSGPSTVSFGSPALADTTVTFSQAGTYRVNLRVARGAYVLDEPYDLVVSTTTPPADVAPYVLTPPAGLALNQGDTATFTVSAQGSAPLIYQWRRNGVPLGSPTASSSYVIGSVSAGSAGTYDCVITNAAGTVTSASATLVVNGIGTFRWGGLWRDVFTGISGSLVSDLTSSANYPLLPDASGVITTAESPSNYADNYGQRWSGWITPPQTGNYRFYIACDDHAELWISTDDKRANRVLRARETSWRASRDWPTNTSDESVSPQLALVAGQRYYVELLHKEGGGGDNAAITWDWQSPGVWTAPTVGSAPLPGAILEYQEGGTLDDAAHPPANYAPVAFDQAVIVFGGASTPVQLTGQDFENASLTYTVLTNPTKGTLSGTEPNLIYTPSPGVSGVDSFTFKVNDGLLDSEPGTVTFSMIPQSSGDLKIWNGSSSALWTTAANWNGSVVPDSNDAVVFNGDSLSNLATSLNADRTISRIVVIDPAGPVSIAENTNTLTLSGGIEMLPATADLTISSAVSISAAQEWSVGAGRTLLKSGAISGSNTLTKSGPGILEFSGVATMTGGIVVNDGTVKLSGGGWYTGHVGGTGMVTVNQGAVAINVNAHSFGSGDNPDRDITLNGGSFLLGAETYVDDVTATAGLIDNTVGGTGGIQSRSGDNSVFTVNASDQSTVVRTEFKAIGTWAISVADGAASNDLVMSGPMTGSATITKNGAGRMLVSSTSTHNGTFTLGAGEVAVSGSLASGMSIQSAGTLSGTGTVQGTVSQSGIVSPGIDGIAVLNLGALSQTSTAITRITLNGTSPGIGHDQLAVTGAATLAGTLQLSLQSGYTPPIGAVFDVITCASRTGTFSTISLPALPTDREWVTTYNGGPTAGLRLSVKQLTIPVAHAGDDQTVVISGDAPVLWTAAELTTAAWFDGADASTLTTVGGAVSQWNDKSGNGRHVSQAVADQQPSYSNNAVVFDGVDDLLKRNTAFIYANGSADVYIVGAFDGGNFDKRLFAESNSADNNPWYSIFQGRREIDATMTSAYIRDSSNTIRLSNASILSASGALDLSARKLYQARDTGSSVVHRVGGGSTVSLSYTRGATTLDRFGLGGFPERPSLPSGGSFMRGDLNELIVVPSLLSDSDRQKVEGYLAHKWGLTAGLPSAHPYKSAAPTEGSGPTATATLAGSASDGDNDPLTTTWSVISKPEGATVTFASASALNTTVTFSAVGSYVLRLTASDGTATAYDDVTITVTYGSGLDAFADWAAIGGGGGGVTFTGDSNSDGLADGMAWLLGSENPAHPANGLLPQQSAEPNGNLTITFKMLNPSKRGTAVLRLEHSHDLGVTDPWSENIITIPDANSTVDGVEFTITPIEGTDHNQVTATLPAAAANGTGKLFVRLNGVLSP